MTSAEMKQMYSDKIALSHALIADADVGWGKNPQTNKITVHIGSFNPGDKKRFKVIFRGQRLHISHVTAGCPCTTDIGVRSANNEDFGEYQVIEATLSVLDLESIMNTDQDAKNGVKLVSRYFALDVLYKEAELEAFLVSDEGNFHTNPMAFWTRVNVTYTINLDEA